MKILVLGSGVIGTTSAYYLAKAGHEVTVVDRQSAPALETSFANAGEVSPGYSSPWAAPGVPLKAIKWMFMQHSPLIIKPMLDMAMWRWGAAMLRNCTHARYEINKGRMVKLAEYSRDCLRQLRADTGIAYDERAQGTLQLFRSQKQLDGIGADMDVLRQYAVPFQVLDRAGCISAEPALSAVQDKFVGGLRLPGDETGDCLKFTQKLAELAIAIGVTFCFNTSISGIACDSAEISGVSTDMGTLAADAYLVALGSYAPQVLAPIGIHIPVYPVKGYSITVPVKDDGSSPQSTVMDETHKVAITRLGDRIRVGGTAELAGYSTALSEERRGTLNHVLTDLFPHAGDVNQGKFWAGLRPMTPDGTPIVGGCRFRNLYLATGHGTLGWTMAAGTGRIVADLMSGRPTEIDADGLHLKRYA